MSRIGKGPVTIPNGVEVKVSGGEVVVKGPKGTLSEKKMRDIDVTIVDKNVVFAPSTNDRKASAKWGLMNVLVKNMIIGVTAGFKKTLEIEGIGYKAELKGKSLVVSAGYSHPIMFLPREGVTFALEGPTKVTVSGMCKQMVGQVAAEIRGIRPPEPYKGKGIRYQGERIIRKAGKTGTK